MFKKFNQYNCIPTKTPYDASSRFKKHLGPSVSALEYDRVIDSLMYLMNCTRPNIAYVVNRLSWYTSNHNNEHLDALIQVFRYLRYILEWEYIIPNSLLYLRDNVMLTGFSIPMKANLRVDIHIRKRQNTMHQLLKDGVIAIDYVKSSDNIANPLTKRLARVQWVKLVNIYTHTLESSKTISDHCTTDLLDNSILRMIARKGLNN
ncbi:uncharacterized protein LOC111400555 [Olea europaea var. sylvestris]|uniref:uncharacterized protein LOC111400555 n=1 Tax=Olea europaea var. sylvestris TaxID=158386 RepID=UPI000C1D10A4|nr:uncharacterized protein LOC111400555 [Olea europaea var. sylvestris]